MMNTTPQLFAIACSLLLGCSTALMDFNENQATPRVGKEFSLKVGQQAKVDGVDLNLKFTGVPQDSRCPTNVNCVWAGNAEVALEWTHNKCTTTITLNTHATCSNQRRSQGEWLTRQANQARTLSAFRKKDLAQRLHCNAVDY